MLQHLTFYSEKVFNRYLFSKAEGQTNQSRLFNAFGDVHYVNVKPSIFDVIYNRVFNVTSESLQHIA